MPRAGDHTTDWVILHGGALGDLALTIALALRLPGIDRASHIELVARSDPGDLRACRPAVTRRSPEGLGLHWLHADSPDPPPDALRRLVAGRRVLSALGSPGERVHRRLRLLGPRTLLSLDPRPDAAAGPGGDAGQAGPRHITEQWATQLASQGIAISRCAARGRGGRSLLHVPDVMRERGRALLADALAGFETGPGGRSRAALDDVVRADPRSQRPVLLIHPGSGSASKCWPLASFAAVAARVADVMQPVFLLGPVEVERWPGEIVAGLRSRHAVVVGPDAGDLAALLAASAVLSSNDAGPAHLAALLGTPTVTLFGPTAARVWRPVGACAVALQGDPAADARNWGLDATAIAERVRMRRARPRYPC